MSRTINSATSTASKSQQINLCVLGEFRFKDETFYLNTSPIQITYNGNSYFGVGSLGSIEVIRETDEIEVTNIKLSLNGANSTIREYVSKLEYANRRCILYAVLLNSLDVVIGTPVVIYDGLMDNMSMSLGQDSTIQLIVTNHVADWNRTRNGRYTSAEQKLIDNTDTGLDHLEDAILKREGVIEVDWKPAIV